MSTSKMFVTMLALVNLTACAGRSPDDQASSSAEAVSDSTAEALRRLALARVPFRIEYLNNDISFVTQVTVGGSTFDAEIDTGSSGLRVATDLLNDGDLATTSDQAVNYCYGSGACLVGTVATATVTIGGLSTPAPIAIQRIESVGCTAAKPTCPAAGVALSDFAFKGKTGGTPRAIMGVGMRNGPFDIANPISQLHGHPAFVVDVPGGYGAPHGMLRIGPTRAERGTFMDRSLPDMPDPKTPPNGVPSKDDTSLPVCVSNQTTGLDYCAPALFDTGTGPILVNSTSASNAHPMAAGSSVEVFYVADAGEAFRYAFDVGDPATVGLDAVRVQPSQTDGIILGTSVFFQNKVLFDQGRGLIGVKPH